MTSSLSAVPIRARRRLAATVGLFAVLFVAIGAVAATGGTGFGTVIAVVALIVAVLLGLTAWGFARSIKIDLADKQLETAIDDAMAAIGGHGAMCSCEHAHDPDELHIADAPEGAAAACHHDGSGAQCAHNCDTCVLAALRPTPARTGTERVTG